MSTPHDEPRAADGETAISRRAMLELVALTTVAAACDGGAAATRAVRTAAPGADTAGTAAGARRFFTPHEWDTVRVLVDLIIPRDVRSGSATDAGVPEFMDVMLAEYPHDQLAIRGGLAWLDRECGDRFGATFATCSDVQRKAVLDDIAWPARARPGHSQGVAFFDRFRDLTASGFWSSKMGMADLQYMGNTTVSEWNGCPEAALKKLGVSYS